MFGFAEVGDETQTLPLKDWSAVAPTEAIDAFRDRNIVTDATFVKMTDKAKRVSFNAGSLLQKYSIETTHSILLDSLEEGLSQQEVIKRVKEGLDSAGVTGVKNYHIERVFRQNIQTAYQDGRYTKMARLKRTRPFWQYSTAGDERVRPEHADLDGVVYPADSPFWSTWYPPNGFMCRCTVFALSQDDIDDEDLSVTTKLPKDQPDEGFRNSPVNASKDARKLDGYNKQLDELPGYKGPK